MEGDFIKINNWLKPLSWLYGVGVGLRNFCFDIGVLKSHDFDVPVISVGNITVGGTGKTPHVEYLVRLLQEANNLKIAVLSRGYKRKKRGFIIADDGSTSSDIGDEPFQMKRKFPRATVAVCKKRVKGIELLLENQPKLDAIVLDDAFQHRYVKPGINILLVDYHRLIIYDTLLPAGRLREPLSGKNRADIVIVTKCPRELKPMNYRVITKAMNLYPYQNLYFTTLEYEPIVPLFADCGPASASSDNDGGKAAHSQPQIEHKPNESIVLLTGIASPDQLTLDLQQYAEHIVPLTFADHHNFTKKDIRKLQETFEKLPEPRRIITTEKDAARLLAVADKLPLSVKQNIWVLPVRIKFMLDQEEKFNENIIGYVRKNSRNSILTKSRDTGKPKDSDHKAHGRKTISFK